MPGMESFSGVAEKATAVPFPVLMRVGLPGLLATLLFYPLARPFPHWTADFTEHIGDLLLLAICTLVAGLLCAAFSNEFYKIYEGRYGWPAWMRRLALWQQQHRVAGRFRRQAEEDCPQAEFDELWFQLRDYPVKDQAPYAIRPTHLGNLLYTYEHYPLVRYGMDAAFYWTRLSMVLDKDVKEEIDREWSKADGFLAMSAVSFLGGTLWLILALVARFGFAFTRTPTGRAMPFAGLALILLGYAFYRATIPFCRQNGERFKAIFDVYRSKIWDMTQLKPAEEDLWTAAWAYYQYHELICETCGEFNYLSENNCSQCGVELHRSQANFKRSGKFPVSHGGSWKLF